MIFRKLWWKNLIVIGIFFLVIMLISSLFLPSYNNQEKVTVIIPKGKGSFQIAQDLSQKKLIKSKVLFLLLSKILCLEKNLKAGSYEFSSSNMLKILDKLKKGEVKTYRVTIPEGLTKWDIADILDKRGIIEKDKFLTVVNNPSSIFKKESFLPESNLEGYLYPDTYYFTKGEDTEEVVKKFVFRFKKMIFLPYQELKEKNTFPLRDIVIMASIIEKEAQLSSEKPIIAAVFYNRLKKGMRLRADPTIKYALGSFRIRLTRSELLTPSFYNTYLYNGLPPGPICNPGKDSIYAALYPANADYFYFVAKGDGSHKFSKTYKEHLEAVYKYRK
ncbi:endolytic transglycosylase MltG [Candidatus Aerophobetes bacterium]|nr:endolytic transglycosylase MltG [Candidatus Aerophobetes bacterium]